MIINTNDFFYNCTASLWIVECSLLMTVLVVFQMNFGEVKIPSLLLQRMVEKALFFGTLLPTLVCLHCGISTIHRGQTVVLHLLQQVCRQLRLHSFTKQVSQRLFLGVVPIILRLFSKTKGHLLFSNYSWNNLPEPNRCAETKVTMHADCLECNELDPTTSIGQLVR